MSSSARVSPTPPETNQFQRILAGSENFTEIFHTMRNHMVSHTWPIYHAQNPATVTTLWYKSIMEDRGIKYIEECLGCSTSVARHYLNIFHGDVKRAVEVALENADDNGWWRHPWNANDDIDEGWLDYDRTNEGQASSDFEGVSKRNENIPDAFRAHKIPCLTCSWREQLQSQEAKQCHQQYLSQRMMRRFLSMATSTLLLRKFKRQRMQTKLEMM